ncbi:hypothetical protein ACWCO7_34320, partial [Streptomyces violaceorubidus]
DITATIAAMEEMGFGHPETFTPDLITPFLPPSDTITTPSAHEPPAHTAPAPHPDPTADDVPMDETDDLFGGSDDDVPMDETDDLFGGSDDENSAAEDIPVDAASTPGRPPGLALPADASAHTQLPPPPSAPAATITPPSQPAPREHSVINVDRRIYSEPSASALINLGDLAHQPWHAEPGETPGFRAERLPLLTREQREEIIHLLTSPMNATATFGGVWDHISTRYHHELTSNELLHLHNSFTLHHHTPATDDEHMTALREQNFTTPPENTATGQWLTSVTSGKLLITRAHHEELKAAHINGIENARIIEDQKLLHSKDHMEILRKNNFKPSSLGETARTYRWLNRVKWGSTVVPQIHLDELRAANVQGLKKVRTTENRKKLTAEDHIEILRKNNFKPSSYGETARTYKWLNDVKSGSITVSQIHLDEMRAAHVPDLDNARITKDRKKLTAEEHMEILRKNNFEPSSLGETARTYNWLNHVKFGRSTVSQIHLDEMRAANVPDLDNARTTKEKLTAEDHMKILRKNNFKPSRRGETARTYKWLNDVKLGRITVSQIHLDEMRAANVPDLEKARATEDQKKLTAEEHMKILRKNNFKPSSYGETARTYKWLNDVKLGRMTVSRVHLDEMHAANVPDLEKARATEDQKKLTAEDHMKILRKNKFVLRIGGDTQQTYQWLNDVKLGKITVSRVHLDEMRAAHVPGLDTARPR